jgi:hypothetical protein
MVKLIATLFVVMRPAMSERNANTRWSKNLKITITVDTYA